jgi:putative membrane protein
MDYSTIKALHIIFIVTWFSGLFYIIRLFIYHTEAANCENELEKQILFKQFKIMEKRLWYGITWPSAILTLIFATLLLTKNPAWLSQGWMHIKLTFVVVLYAYHFYTHHIFKQLQKDNFKWSSFYLRMYNEVATVILVAVVFLVVLKNSISWIWGVTGILLFAVLLMLAIRIYKRIREKSDK